jgi:hypothetical protein
MGHRPAVSQPNQPTTWPNLHFSYPFLRHHPEPAQQASPPCRRSLFLPLPWRSRPPLSSVPHAAAPLFLPLPRCCRSSPSLSRSSLFLSPRRCRNSLSSSMRRLSKIQGARATPYWPRRTPYSPV